MKVHTSSLQYALTRGPHKVAPTSKTSAWLLITHKWNPQREQTTWIKAALKKKKNKIKFDYLH